MRLNGLLWMGVLSLAALPLSCGDDASNGAHGAGDAGETTNGGEGLDSFAGAVGTSGKAAGGEAALGGAASTLAGAGSALGGESSDGGGASELTCKPRAEIPGAVGTTLHVQSTCKAETPCAGELDGTSWAYSDVCLDQEQIFKPVYSQCPSSKLNGPADVNVNGSLSFSGGSLKHQATISATGVFQIPNECHYCDCKGEQDLLKQAGAGPNTFCYQDCYPDLSCRCLVDLDVTVLQDETFSATGSTLTLKSGAKYDYCAQADSLSLTEKSAAPGLPGTVTLIPAAATVTPEICDGLDNDKNGEIDDNPIDCPAEPCLSDGVCEGVKPTCNGQWLCDYSAVKRELGDETTCDGLDNDCDGLVDEKLVGCFETCDGLDNDNDGTVDDDPAGSPCSATLGVCATGATSTCLGKAGWRCDFASPNFEPAETKCDGLDNDCDGQVDEGCNCATGKSQMFVVHWGQTPELIRADLDGSNVTPIPALSGFPLTKVVVDSKANKLYFGDGSNKIQRSNLDGSNIEVLWTGQAQTWDVNPATGLLLGECNTSNVCKLTTPNTYATLFQPAAVAGLDIDPVNRVIYWSDYGTGAKYYIRRVGFDGSNQVDVVKDAQAALSVAVDPAGQRIYWPNGNGIYQAHLDGSNEVLWLPLASSYTYDMAIDHHGGKLYFTDVNANEVRRVGLDGKNYEPLIKNVTYAVSISLYLCP